jgi:hypothetical protein
LYDFVFVLFRSKEDEIRGIGVTVCRRKIETVMSASVKKENEVSQVSRPHLHCLLPLVCCISISPKGRGDAGTEIGYIVPKEGEEAGFRGGKKLNIYTSMQSKWRNRFAG